MIKTAEFATLALVLLISLVLVFQIFVPLVTGTPFFPILRQKRKEAVAKLAEATEDKEVYDIEEAVKTLQAKVGVKDGKTSGRGKGV